MRGVRVVGRVSVLWRGWCVVEGVVCCVVVVEGGGEV